MRSLRVAVHPALRRGKEGWVDFLFTIEKDGTTSDHFAYFSMDDRFINAARQGHSSAGFFLGRNLLYGDACEADSDKSHFWLLQSANDGDIDAQYLLALELFSGARFTKNPGQALFWLKEAATQKQAARLRYAWVLATHPDERVRSASLAHTYWDSLDDDYPDRQRYYMTAAAIAAERGDFEQAVHWQEKALEDAKQLKLPLGGREAHLALYREGKPLRELP